MSLVEQELLSQPSCWRDATRTAAEHSTALPQRGERVAVVGCGTSLYMSQAYAALREASGHGETDAFPASEFRSQRRYDRVVVISRSGTTTEVIELLAGPLAAAKTLAITADTDAPLVALASDSLVPEGAREESVVQTRFATTALAVLRAGLGESLDIAIRDGERAIAEPLPVDIGAHHQFVFLGSGWAAAVASEAALKCREAAGAWTEAYPAMEYRHGPISASGPGTAVWVLGALPDGLLADINRTGATLITSALDPMAELIRAQRLAVAIALDKGLDPDHPKWLSFSVVLHDSR
jgi:fructoselysine-6-P-deglycase FrlB-like protein